MEVYIPQGVSQFLPGLLLTHFENLTKYWPQELTDRLAAQYSNLHLSAIWPSFELSSQQQPTWFYLGIAFFVLCLVGQLLDDSDTLHSQDLTLPTLTPYEALATVFTPLSSCHPKHYRPILAHISTFLAASRRRNATVALDFEKTWRTIVHGHLELRDESVLEDLFTASAPGSGARSHKHQDEVGARAFGCLVAFEFAWRWRMNVAWMILFARMQLWVERCKWLLGIKWTDDVPNLDTCLVDDTLDLDFIPISHITSAVSVAKRRLALDSTFEYDHLNVEFTCLASDVEWMSKRFLLCCAILVPSLGHNLSKSKKTALPFLVSCADIASRVQAISSGAHSFKDKAKIQAVKDISMLHADALELHENDMVFDRWVRSGFVARHGPDAWRETRLRLKWEAALLRAKVLVRWKVAVSVRD